MPLPLVRPPAVRLSLSVSAALTGVIALATAAVSGPAAAPAATAVKAADATATWPAQAAQAHDAGPAARSGHRPGRRALKARAAISAEPYRIYDSITPSAIPGGNVVATYATGGYAVPAAAVRHEKKLLWIDTRATDPGASVLDVEPGDATPSQAAGWAWRRLHGRPHSLARIYTMRNEWAAARAAVAQLPDHMRSQVRWWIADPTGIPHVVPGSDATQWYWGHGYDITTATPRF